MGDFESGRVMELGQRHKVLPKTGVLEFTNNIPFRVFKISWQQNCSYLKKESFSLLTFYIFRFSN